MVRGKKSGKKREAGKVEKMAAEGLFGLNSILRRDTYKPYNTTRVRKRCSIGTAPPAERRKRTESHPKKKTTGRQSGLKKVKRDGPGQSKSDGGRKKSPEKRSYERNRNSMQKARGGKKKPQGTGFFLNRRKGRNDQRTMTAILTVRLISPRHKKWGQKQVAPVLNPRKKGDDSIRDSNVKRQMQSCLQAASRKRNDLKREKSKNLPSSRKEESAK